MRRSCAFLRFKIPLHLEPRNISIIPLAKNTSGQTMFFVVRVFRRGTKRPYRILHGYDLAVRLPRRSSPHHPSQGLKGSCIPSE